MNLPIIQHHSFTEGELKTCEEGQCCRCGVCCTAFSIREVQSIPGDASSPTIPKTAGVPCPQLTVLPDGTMGCLIHDDSMRPAICQEWRGDLIEGSYRYSHIKDRVHAQVILFPEKKLGILAAEHAFLTGTVTELTQRIIQNSIRSELANILKAHLIRCNYYSALIMKTIGMKAVLQEMYWTRERALSEIALQEDNPEHNHFLADHFHLDDSYVSVVGRAGLEPAKA